MHVAGREPPLNLASIHSNFFVGWHKMIKAKKIIAKRLKPI